MTNTQKNSGVQNIKLYTPNRSYKQSFIPSSSIGLLSFGGCNLLKKNTSLFSTWFDPGHFGFIMLTVIYGDIYHCSDLHHIFAVAAIGRVTSNDDNVLRELIKTKRVHLSRTICLVDSILFRSNVIHVVSASPVWRKKKPANTSLCYMQLSSCVLNVLTNITKSIYHPICVKFEQPKMSLSIPFWDVNVERQNDTAAMWIITSINVHIVLVLTVIIFYFFYNLNGSFSVRTCAVEHYSVENRGVLQYEIHSRDVSKLCDEAKQYVRCLYPLLLFENEIIETVFHTHLVSAPLPDRKCEISRI